MPGPDLDDLHALAAAGVAGAGGALPHAATIQRSFGHHDVSDIRAHADGTAALASAGLGAAAYARGSDVAFAGGSPDLHTAAHEAAHVVQQRAGLQLTGGLGQPGDAHEQHADAVADTVVRGDSAVALLDTPAAAAAPRSGGAAHAIQRQPAAAGAPEGPSPGIGPSLSPDAERLAAASARLQTAADISHEIMRKLRAKTLTPAQAAVRLTAALTGLDAAVAALADNHRQHAPADTLGKARRVLQRGLSPDQEGEEGRARADETLTPRTVANLDALVGDALEITAALEPDAPARGPLKGAVDTMAASAAGLSWQRPASLDEARTRSFERDACPADENDLSPRACTMTDGERAGRRAEVVRRLREVARRFFAACKTTSEELQRAIDADQRLARMAIDVAVDLIVGVISGGAAGVAGAVVKGPAMSKGVQRFAGDVGKALFKTGATKAPQALGAQTDTPDARDRTISAIDDLAAQFESQINASIDALSALDDAELATLDARLAQFDVSLIARHVKRFADNYLTQVAPIGIEHPDSEHLFEGGWYRSDLRATGRAVRIALPGGRVKLALVEELTERQPGVGKAARTVAVAADRLVGDKDDSLYQGGAYRARQDAFVADPHVERHFIRWIDDPRMADVAGADAPTVPAAQVTDLPLNALSGPLEPATATGPAAPPAP